MAGRGTLAELRNGRKGRFAEAREIPWVARARVLAGWFVTLTLAALILVIPLPFTGQVVLREGDVAPTDIRAPRQVSFISEILSEQRRELAASAVPQVYDPPEVRIGRQRLTLANQIIDFIGSVRNDTYADLLTKVRYLESISAVKLSRETINRILSLSAPSWERVAAEIQSVLERTMREEIREDTLADERRRVAARIRLDLADEDAAIVREIVQALVVPNSFYNSERTEEQQQEARNRVEPAMTTVVRGEVILRAGDIVTPLDIEALDALGLRQSNWSWQDIRRVAGPVLLLGLVFLYYLWRLEPQLWSAGRELLLLALAMLVFLLVARAVVPTHALLPYAFPYAALTMLLSVGLNLRLALISMAFFVLLLGWLATGNLELMTYAFCGAAVGALRLRKGERLSSFAWAGVYVAAINLLVIFAFRLGGGEWDLRGLAELSVAALVNALVSITVTLVGIYAAGSVFGITTSLQLMDLSRPTHPLLRQLLLKAPGTYHHTLIISNMAERAAEAIGADAQLARVGAYYHDVGKTIRPYFFIENRNEDMDPHARLDPLTSAQIIISHVKDGVELARKYHLPRSLIDFIPEHQGTLLVHYFYHQAVTSAGSPDQVDKTQYTYPGPKPQSRETAITMLADGVEATVRARHPGSTEELTEIIAESIQSRVDAGQLDECPLTLNDLQEIRRAFFDVLRGIHHPRITYPALPASDVAARPLLQVEAEEPYVAGFIADESRISETVGEDQHPGR